MINKIKTNADRFTKAYNTIRERLREVANEKKEASFPKILSGAISRGDNVARKYEGDLKEFADLRNAIVHESTDCHPIAEPHDRTVEIIEHIASLLLKPPKVLSLAKKQVSTVQSTSSIAEAVKIMYKNNFSQLPVYNEDGKFEALLTANTVARWLGACVEEDIFSLKETRISSVLDYREKNEKGKFINSCEFISREKTVFDALRLFENWEEKGTHLDAIFIMDNGKPDEKPFGIITAWDIPKIYERIKIKSEKA